jgi:hypothetical protein
MKRMGSELFIINLIIKAFILYKKIISINKILKYNIYYFPTVTWNLSVLTCIPCPVKV